MEEDLIISVKEFRKLAGKEVEALSDDEIKELILDLDFVAELFVKSKFKEISNES